MRWVDRRTEGRPRARPIAEWWFEPIPKRRIELTRRIVFGYAALWLLVRARYVGHVADLDSERFQPVGLLAPLREPPGKPVVSIVWLVGLTACIVVCTGRSRRVATATGSVAMLVIVTLTSSFGQVFHTEHLLVIHMIILAAASNLDIAVDETDSGWPLNLMMSAAAVTYVVAGIAKLRYGAGTWISGEGLQNWVAADNLRKVLLEDPSSTLGGWLAHVGWVWPLAAIVTLMVELGAPIALRPGRARAAWIGAAWLFHVGVYALMAIAFPYQLSGVAYVAFLRVEQIEAGVRERARRLMPSSSTRASTPI